MLDLSELNVEYRLVTAFREISEIQDLEKSLFLTETFRYERDFLMFPFREHFNIHSFLESHDFFRQEEQFIMFIRFLKSINSSSFFISSPPYCCLYPLKISVDCPFTVYKYAISYVLEEIITNSQNQRIRQPLNHPMRGAGFVIMPHVFMYDETRQWAMFLDDNITEVAVIGIKEPVREAFTDSLSKLGFVSILELIEKPIMKSSHIALRENDLIKYGNVRL